VGRGQAHARSAAESEHAAFMDKPAVEIAPKIQEYRSEMKAVADRMCGDMGKGIITWQVPTLALDILGYYSLGEVEVVSKRLLNLLAEGWVG